MTSVSPPAAYAAPSPPGQAVPVYPPPTPAGPPVKRKGHAGPLVAVVIVILLALAGLWYLGYLGRGSSSSSPEPAQDFAGTEPTASSYAQGVSGGPWTLVEAVGFAFPVSTPVNDSGSSFTCAGSAPPFTTWPADSAGVGTGKSPLWVFVFTSSAGSELGVLVNGGVASESWLYLKGSACLSSPLPDALPSAGLVDSTAAASVAGTAGGTSYLSSNAGAAVEESLYQGTSSGPDWFFTYSLCLADTGHLVGAEPSFFAEVNATTGVLVSSSSGEERCGPVQPSEEIGFGSVGAGTNPTGSTNYDNFSLSATSGLTTTSFGMKIITPSGALVAEGATPSGCSAGASPTACAAPGNGWYAVLISAQGTVLSAWGSSGSWSVSGVAISASETLTLISPTSVVLAGSGDTLSVFGIGTAIVSGQATL